MLESFSMSALKRPSRLQLLRIFTGASTRSKAGSATSTCDRGSSWPLKDRLYISRDASMRQASGQNPSQNPLRKRGTLSRPRFAKAALLYANLHGRWQGSALIAGALYIVSVGRVLLQTPPHSAIQALPAFIEKDSTSAEGGKQ